MEGAFFIITEMKVLKFGGTSVGSVEALKALMAVVKSNIDQNEKIIVVVSAMGGVTNQLLQMAEDSIAGNWYPCSNRIKSLPN